MIVVGAIGFLVLACVYVGLVLALARACFVLRSRRARSDLTLNALLGALVACLVAPGAWWMLYSEWSFAYGDEVVLTRPRLVESPTLAFALPWLVAFAAVLALRARAARRTAS